MATRDEELDTTVAMPHGMPRIMCVMRAYNRVLDRLPKLRPGTPEYDEEMRFMERVIVEGICG